MLYFIWDKVRKILPAALLVGGSGTLCFLLMRHAGEDAAAWVGLATIGIAVGLVLLMVFYALRDLLRWRKAFDVAAAMDDFRDAQALHPNCRAGQDRLFFNSVALEYGDIRTLYCTYEHTTSARGYVNWWYMLYAVRTDGKKFRVLPIQERPKAASRAEATALFTRIMDLVAEMNPDADLRYPDYR